MTLPNPVVFLIISAPMRPELRETSPCIVYDVAHEIAFETPAQP